MPGFDGNGNYVRFHNWTADAANLININAGEMDQEDSGFASAFGNCITRDGQGKATADLNPNVTNSYNLGTVGLAWATLNGIPVSRLTSAGAGDIRNYGAVSGTDCATAVTNSASANKLVIIPPGSWPMATTPTIGADVVIQSLPGSTFSGAGAAALGFTTGALIQEIEPSTLSTDFAIHYIRRNAIHTGGTPGGVSNALHAETYVSSGVTNFEWAFTAKVDNSATGGQNVGGYLQGIKRSTGPTWGATIEIIEATAVNNPTSATVGLEIDVSVNGTDNASGSRVGCDLVIRKFNQAGVAGQANFGYRIQNGNDGVSNVGFGYSFASGMIANVGFDTSHATMSSAAYQMATGQPIIFDGPTPAQHQLMVQPALLGLDYLIAGTLKNRLLASGGFQVGTSQVVGPRNTGWNAMTGTSDNATVFNTASVTLAQLASRVNALQAACTTHGLIGLT